MKQGWEIKKLLDVVDFQRGLTYSKNDEVDFSENMVLRSNNVDLKTNKLDFTEIRYINPKIVIPENKKVTKGSLIICTANGSKSHLGKVALIDDDYDYAFGGFMGLIKPKENLNSDFLFHLMTSDAYKKFIGALSDGANINNLKFGDLGEFEIPLPPLPEQQRIVAILDEAFAAIAKAKANAEQNLKNAKELFESYLQGVFENKGEGWEEKTLGEIADVEYGYTDKSTEEGDYRYIRITDIDKNGELILEDKKYIKHSKEAEGFLIQDNDLLMARTGATFAKVLLYNGDEPSVFASYLIRIKFKEKIENALYWHFTKTKNYWEQANSLQSGAAQPHFNGAAVKQVVFAYPKSIKEQKSLIVKFETLSIETKKLEAIYQQKINDLEELKKSILQKAFSGDLNTETALV